MVVEVKPPNSQDSERAVLGAMLQDQDALNALLEDLTEDKFYYSDHRVVFKGIKTLFDKGVEVDAVTVGNALEDDVLNEIGGLSFLTELVMEVPSINNIKYYADNVKEKYYLRRLLNVSTLVKEKVFAEPEAAMEIAELELNKLSLEKVKSDDIAIGDVVNDVAVDYEARWRGEFISTGLRPGFKSLMDIVGGFRDGELIVVAARPSMGKTTFALNLIHDLSVLQGSPVIMFSLEMLRKQIVNNMTCLDAGIDSDLWQNQTSRINEGTDTLIRQSFERLKHSSVIIDDDSLLTPSIFKAKLRRYKKEHGIQCAFIDYLQLMTAPEVAKQGRTQEVSTISRTVKAVARELEIPIFALAQLNRGVENRADKKPAMSDLRESGSIEQDADIVMLLHRDDYYSPEERPGMIDVIVAKNRNGRTGTASLKFDREIFKFRDIT